MSKFTLISLFSGCGGLDIGFHKKGFSSLICIENNPIMVETLKDNKVSKNLICDDIAKASNSLISKAIGLKKNEVDLVLGGPPCPAFSKSRFYRKDMSHGTNDESFETVKEYFRVVEGFMPKVFVFENVNTFAAKRQNGALEYVLQRAKELGYHTTYKVLNAADYGVPQKRERLIIVGTKSKNKFQFPEKTHRSIDDEDLLNSHLPLWRTAGDAINDLDTKKHESDLPGHFAGGKDHELLKEIPPGDNYLFFTKERGNKNPKFKWRSRYWSFLLKLSPNKPSWTIQARRSNNMGPFHWRSRILTIDEVKRLQTFPDDFMLSGSIENQWRQIGNAVPPKLAEAIAESVRDYLKNDKKR
jgi:DNA (cytosine-5)-methyltransferase 1